MDKAYYSQVRLRRQADPEARFTPEDVEQFEAHRVKCYMAVTRDWEHIDRDGAPLACVPVNLEWLYNLPWVAGQLLEFMSDLKNFGAPVGTENGHMPDLIGDAEKKSLTGVSGSLQ